MNVEKTEIVWLTSKEVEQAVRAFVRAEGFQVLRWAPVEGLGEISEDKYAVSIRVEHNTREVKV